MKIVLIDRDGTVIVDPPDERVDKKEKIELFPDSLESLKYLADNGFSVILITNQAGISEGRISTNEFEEINNVVIKILEPSGIKILKTYMCPHVQADNCTCRKPKPTMILEAGKDYNLDLSNSYMVGDRESDIKAGMHAGTKTILVNTANKPQSPEGATYSAASLLDAVKHVVKH